MTKRWHPLNLDRKDFNPHTVRTVWHYSICRKSIYQWISIHIPLARYDVISEYLPAASVISIHIPLARYDVTASSLYYTTKGFQSTYRSRSMTFSLPYNPGIAIIISIHIPLAQYDWSCFIISYSTCNFNPHTARAVWLEHGNRAFQPIVISIHIPLARYDKRDSARYLTPIEFQSTYRSRSMTEAVL